MKKAEEEARRESLRAQQAEARLQVAEKAREEIAAAARRANVLPRSSDAVRKEAEKAGVEVKVEQTDDEAIDKAINEAVKEGLVTGKVKQELLSDVAGVS